MAVSKSRRHVGPWWENEKMTLRPSKKKKNRNSAEILLSIFLHNFRSIFHFFVTKNSVEILRKKMDKRTAV